MSIGLNDLGKKRPAKLSTKTSTASYPAGAWAGKNTVARPWTTITKDRGRQLPHDFNAVMNEDWIRVLTQTPFWSLNWAEAADGSFLLRVYTQLLALEHLMVRIHSAE